MKILVSARFLFTVFIILYSDLIVLSQVCNPEYATKSYNSRGITTSGFAVRAPNGDYIFGGGPNQGNALLRLDKDGNLLWSKEYSYTNPVMYNDRFSGAVDSTGNLAFSIKAEVMVLGNANGDVLTMKRLRLNYSNLAIWKILVLPDNKKLVLAKDYSGYGTDPFLLLCLSPDLSSILWTKSLIAYDLFLPEMAIRNNSVVIIGSQTEYGVMVELNISNGALISQQRLKIDDRRTFFRGIYPWQNGYLLVGNYIGINGETNTFILRLNPALAVVSSFRFTNNNADYTPRLAVNNDGSYYGAYGSMAHYRFYMSAADSLRWNRFIGIAGIGGLVYFTAAPDGLVSFTSGTYFDVAAGADYRSYIMNKSTYEGIRPGCDWQPSPLPRQPITISGFPALINIRDTSMVTLVTVNPVVTDFINELGVACNVYSTCDALDVSGPVAVCAPDTVIFTGLRNPGCLLPVNWSISGGAVVSDKLSDSTLSVQFTQPGSYTIIASLGNSCQHIADTIYVQVSELNRTLDLGPRDTTLCAGGSIVLNAHAGYLNYEWQDGSADSVFIVNTPGLYHVTVQNACGQSFSDTIRVTAAPLIPFSAGPDRQRCNNDTLHLQATPGFINYSWGPAYYLTQSGQSWAVVSNPADTFYYVKAESSPGCFLYDTVHVTVKSSPPVNLGADFSLCKGDSSLLFVQPGFQQYTWSTGSQGSSLYVKLPGNYAVAAQASNGCISRDTVTVLQLWDLPVPNIHNDTTLCAGETILLSPGTFNTYHWQDGSHAPVFTVQAAGLYHVQVTNDKGCRAGDTLLISRIIPLPAGFLPADTAVCTYGTLELKASGSYTGYLWNNQSTAPAIQINTAGKYWLQVISREGCTGADTIQVIQKECLKGLLVPGAFTPNNDGRNDKLAPFLFGNIKKFHFDIYNRNGEKVFSTTEPGNGWDGRLRGMLQDAAVYVWYCEYQLEGETPVREKGTFVLIR